MKKQMGFATLVTLGMIVVSFGVGVYYQYCTNIIDSPAEQAAEEILEDYGIDIDFSKDKKDQSK